MHGGRDRYAAVDAVRAVDRDRRRNRAPGADAPWASRLAGSRAIILDLRDYRGGSPAMVAYSPVISARRPTATIQYLPQPLGLMSEAPVGDPTVRAAWTRRFYISRQMAAGLASEFVLLHAAGGASRRDSGVSTTMDAPIPGLGFVPVSKGFAVFVSGGSPGYPGSRHQLGRAGVRPTSPWRRRRAAKRAHGVALERTCSAGDPKGPVAARAARGCWDDMRADAPLRSAPGAAGLTPAAYGGRRERHERPRRPLVACTRGGARLSLRQVPRTC
jgi:hypothetical protein